MGLLDLFRRGKIKHVAPRDVDALLATGAHFLDVRKSNEYNQGHATGTRNIPLHVLPRRIDRLDRERPIICICASGMRSAHAARLLDKQGFSSVYNVKGGSQRWRREGLPWKG
jgi:rhodanese-related sulfurtransferase